MSFLFHWNFSEAKRLRIISRLWLGSVLLLFGWVGPEGEKDHTQSLQPFPSMLLIVTAILFKTSSVYLFSSCIEVRKKYQHNKYSSLVYMKEKVEIKLGFFARSGVIFKTSCSQVATEC